MIEFIFKGQMVSGKNQVQTAMVRGRLIKFPNARFKKWRADFQSQLFAQRFGKKLPLPFSGPVCLSVLYYPGDRLRRDLTGILDALFHAVEVKNGGCIVNDDSQFKMVAIEERELRRDAPGISIAVEAIDETPTP